jgi:glycosidase
MTFSSFADNAPHERVRIYQLFVRLFSNINETRKQNGTITENGVGKFNDINAAALSSIRAMGFTHIWLTGVLQQATGTDYSDIGQPADDADLLKGLAGSPYAIKDYFDVCPDYADVPAKRLDEFKALLARIHKNQMKALIDIVPNHVARSYGSDVKPELDFGKDDDPAKPFHPENNFFYLAPGNGGPPLRLPTVKDGKPVSPTCKVPGMQCDGLFLAEKEHGRVTGNNKVSWTPSLDDWYETVKLNYGFDFTAPDKNVREYPNATAPDKPLPDTWKKMDQVFAYWQTLGVDGFRCDMAHMEPPEFWKWAIGRARERNREVFFAAEAYDNDPSKVPATGSTEANCMVHLINAGFDAVYDDPTYRALKKIYEGSAWANDLDGLRPSDLIFDHSLRYAENHDEVRLASKSQWGGHGFEVGPAVCAILYGLSRGPVMLYNGQEVGEPGAGAEGFGSDDSRSSIFDYWSMPEVVKWVNGHKYDGGKLSNDQKQKRAMYARLINVAGEPAFRDGAFYSLNPANNSNLNFGTVEGDRAGGHWMYAFLRYDRASRQRFLIVANLHPSQKMMETKVVFDSKAIGFLNLFENATLTLTDRLSEHDAPSYDCSIRQLAEGGLGLVGVPAHTAYYFEIKVRD